MHTFFLVQGQPEPHIQQAWAVLRQLISTEPSFVVGLFVLFTLDAVAGVAMRNGEVDFTPLEGLKRTFSKALQIAVTIGAATVLSNMFLTFAWLREVAYVGVSVRLASQSIRRVYSEDDDLRIYTQSLLSEFYRRHLHLAANPNARRPKTPRSHEPDRISRKDKDATPPRTPYATEEATNEGGRDS